MDCPCKHHNMAKNTCSNDTPPVIELHSEECPVLFHTVNITAEQGDKDTLPPTYGAYRNARVYYEANKMSYLYDSDGVPQILSGTGADGVASVNGQAGDVIITTETIGAAKNTDLTTEITNRENADTSLSGEISTLRGTVESNTNAISSKANSADVYSKTETDNLLSVKADSDDVYTKNEVDTALASKANSDDVYSKSETDDLLDNKANTSQFVPSGWVSIGSFTSSYNKYDHVVTLNITERATISGTAVTAFTMPEGARPTEAIVGTALADNSGTFELVSITVNTDGTVILNSSASLTATPISGSITYIV